ncbi:MAG: nicotinate phosphoribosyltransferase [Patescibacteria group bacterium]|jgi:nicotinate phosphoribosyltransferase
MIIKSLLDLDYYKLTMAQVAWRHFFHRVPVTYSFTNRTQKVRLADHIAEADLRRELDAARELRFTPKELGYLSRLGPFQPDFLQFLRTFTLPPYDLALTDGQFRIEVSGPWHEAIFWETLILSIVNELYYASLTTGPDATSGRSRLCLAHLEGWRRLDEKIRRLEQHPDIRFIEFGTRRRFSRAWQEMAAVKLATRIPQQMIGTSNVDLARRLGLQPIGTFAHEMFMVFSGIYRGAGYSGFFADEDEAIRSSHNAVLQCWWRNYGEALSIALTDTFGTGFFFRDFTPEQAAKWRGLRQDSGDPFVFGETAIEFYRNLGIDPRTKTIVFSDGLDLDLIESLQAVFGSRIKTAFGWGTNLTNDCGPDPLSLVVKVTGVNGYPTVKLSDNLAKAMGPSDEVEHFKRIFGYEGGTNEECRY